MSMRDNFGTKCNEEGALYLVMKGGDFEAYVFVQDDKNWWIFGSVVNVLSALFEALDENPKLINRFDSRSPVSILSYDSKDRTFTMSSITNQQMIAYMSGRMRKVSPEKLEKQIKELIRKAKYTCDDEMKRIKDEYVDKVAKVE